MKFYSRTSFSLQRIAILQVQLEFPKEARDLADKRQFELKGSCFTAERESLRQPRVVRIGAIQNQIIIPTTEPVPKQGEAMEKVATDVAQCTMKAMEKLHRCCSVYNGAICADTCQCPSQLFYDGTKLCGALGESCLDVTQCSVANTVCTGSGTKTCECKNTHLQVGTSCLKRKYTFLSSERGKWRKPDVAQAIIRESCFMLQCSSANTVCTGSGTKTCQCKNTHFEVGSSCLKRDLGESCSDVTQCSTTNTEGTDIGSGTKIQCQKHTSWKWYQLLRRDNGESCTDVAQCTMGNAICSDTCQCQVISFYDGTNCVKRALEKVVQMLHSVQQPILFVLVLGEGSGESCTDVLQCAMGMLYVLVHISIPIDLFTVRAIIRRGLFRVTQCCLNTAYWFWYKDMQCHSTHLQVGTSCLKRGNGESCTDVAQCTMGDAICFDTCQCPSNLFYDGTNCVKRDLGESCSDVTQCSATNTVCTDTGSGTKTCEEINGESCTDVAQCTMGNAICSDTCQCPSQLFYDLQTVLLSSIGESCSDVTQCSADNTVCTGSGTKTCQCQNTHLQVGTSCLKRDLGESCSDVTQCSVANTVCTDTGSGTKTCQC
ncbi:unnamed protein product [Mytilus edulis]|uniref:Uncharacterized protein n=1 Tax=Mytilus edulis TaxID=6550 RepID=A0A8S3TP35_MYTED|nr:unnamed protein product [Mytilus edulis]